MLVLAVVALVIAVSAREDAYRAADKQTKMFWLVILGATVAGERPGWSSPRSLFLQIAGLIATIVFFVDVRPALEQVSGGGGRPPRRNQQRRPVRPVQRRPLSLPPHSARRRRPAPPHGGPRYANAASRSASLLSHSIQQQHRHVVRQLPAVEVPHLVHGGLQQILAAAVPAPAGG